MKRARDKNKQRQASGGIAKRDEKIYSMGVGWCIMDSFIMAPTLHLLPAYLSRVLEHGLEANSERNSHSYHAQRQDSQLR